MWPEGEGGERTWHEAVKGQVTRSWLAVEKAGNSLTVGACPVKDGCMCLDSRTSRAGGFIPSCEPRRHPASFGQSSMAEAMRWQLLLPGLREGHFLLLVFKPSSGVLGLPWWLRW